MISDNKEGKSETKAHWTAGRVRAKCLTTTSIKNPSALPLQKVPHSRV